MHRRVLTLLITLAVGLSPSVLVTSTARASVDASTAWGSPESCGAPSAPTVVERSYPSGAARSHDYVPVEVPPGTARVDVGYRWSDDPVEPLGQAAPSTPLTATTFDLGLWSGPVDDDVHLVGWSGSRQGRLDQAMRPVWVSATSADRGYRPVDPSSGGTWFVEVGVAAVTAGGATVRLEIACLTADQDAQDPRAEREADGAVPEHVVAGGACDDVTFTDEAGTHSGCWVHADLHLHGVHSNPKAPEWDGVLAQARAAGLDVVPVTEYVTTAHWDELGAVQAANDDLVIWPGREIITYSGHAIVLAGPGRATGGDAELPHDVDHRHGLDPDGADGPAAPITLADIQADVVAAGDVFGVAHPTIFPGPVFANLCRGCAFELGDVIDWSAVTTMEVVTGPVLADLSDAHGAFPSTHAHGLSAQNPFVDSAVDLWEDRLAAGFRISPVQGSDSKGVDDVDQRPRKGYGSSATAILTTERSVAAIRAAIEAGRVVVRTRGVAASPALDLVVSGTDHDGTLHTGTFGSSLPVGRATMSVSVQAPVAATLDGQVLRITRNGSPVAVVALTGTDQTIDVPIVRVAAEERPPEPGGSALGTTWRVDVVDAKSLTAIGNAVFLTGDVVPGP